MRQFCSSRTLYSLTTAVFLLILSGCGSTPAPVVSQPTTQPVVTTEPQNLPKTGDEWENIAKQAYDASASSFEVNSALLSAAEAHIGQGNYQRAQHILLALKTKITDEKQRQYYHFLIVLAYQNSQQVSANELLALLPVQPPREDLAKSLSIIRSDLLSRNRNWYEAANALVDFADDRQSVLRVWQLVNQAISEQGSITPSPKPNLVPYLSLAEIINEFGFDVAKLRVAINDFQQVFTSHPLVSFWPEEIEKAVLLTTSSPDDIVVLLPLSGRFASTGNTVKEGILAAYFESKQQQYSAQENAPDTQIRFIDTHGKSIESIVAEIGDSQWIIGPLLKQNIEALVNQLDGNQTILALNRIDIKTANLPMYNTNTTYFSLAPEDEGQQLAELLSEEGIANPIIVSADSQLYSRMHEAFLNRWQQLSTLTQGSHKITEVRFNDNESLRDGVTGALDVAQSNARIKEVEDLLTEELYKMPRSRRDVDAIVVFASPDHTELLNPVVEASVSPFIGKDIPVYASSRSMDYQKGPNQWRDLQKLQFIDIPWLLPGNPWQRLANEVNSVKANNTANQSRLFALGFDAFNLLPKTSNMATLPQLSSTGLTGTLFINSNGEVVRILPRGKVNSDGIETVVQ